MPAGGNLGPGMGNIRLNQQERAQIVEFLKALTDDRVRYERAPFDHPSLCVPVGYAENPPGVLTPDTSSPGAASAAADLWALVPAVGRTATRCRSRRSPSSSRASDAMDRARTRCSNRVRRESIAATLKRHARVRSIVVRHLGV